MMMWASLANSPPPPCTADGATVYEAETNLIVKHRLQTDRIGHLKFDDILSRCPTVDPSKLLDPAGSKLIRSRSSNSAKSAFLCPSTNKVKRVRKAVATWYEDGWLAALDELSAFSSREDCSAALRLAGITATGLLNLWRNTFSLYGSFNRRHKVSDEDLVNCYTSTKDWSNSVVRCLAWHPQAAKIGVALRDDTIHVLGVDLQVSPVLKHKQQRGVTCLAWRPYLASELAVGCITGILIWTVDPLSVVARPSANCVYILPTPPSHLPVTSLAYHPEGKYLLSSSAHDQSVIIWCTSSERQVPIKCVNRFHDGIQLALWSPQGGAVVTATTSNVFKIVNANSWTQERWTVLTGYLNAASWSACGTTLLFTTSTESQIYCLKFTVGENNFSSAGSAVPVMDLSKVTYTLDDGEEICAGGLVHSMRWDPNSARLVLSFVDCPLLAVLCTRVDPVGISVSPIGYIRGEADELPTAFEFARDYQDGGALLTVAWSTGRVQHFPMFFSSLAAHTKFAPSETSYLLNASAEFNPVIFSSPAIQL